jgi:catechol 2,3-dioxygenase-like lactoylglutathione lyase family enzyme
MRMLCFPDGPSVELFEFDAPDQRSAVIPSDLGLQHLALYADDIEATCALVVAAGGEVLGDPAPIELPLEAGPGNKWCYTRTPWGMTIELITFPGPMGYEATTALRRWKPGLA